LGVDDGSRGGFDVVVVGVLVGGVGEGGVLGVVAWCLDMVGNMSDCGRVLCKIVAHTVRSHGHKRSGLVGGGADTGRGFWT